MQERTQKRMGEIFMKHTCRRLLSTLLLCMLLFVGAKPALAEDYAFVQRDTVVRTSASAKGGTLGKLKAGDSVEKSGIDGDWTQIVYNGKKGYIFSKDTFGHAAKEETRSVRIAKSGNVRLGPGTEYAKLGALKKGKMIAYYGTEGEWAKIEYNGKTAYTLAAFLD